MATVTIITDDITGHAGAATRTFEFNGTKYEIDLTDMGWEDLALSIRLVTDALAVARPIAPEPVAEPVAEPVKRAPYMHPALKHTDPQYRARNAQIVERFHDIKSRKGMTKGRARDIVGAENNLSGERIRQITYGLPHTAAVEYLLTNP